MSIRETLDEFENLIKLTEKNDPEDIAHIAIRKTLYLMRAVKLIEDEKIRKICREYLKDISDTISAQDEKIDELIYSYMMS